jgi:carboxyl-terminal processing protease
MKTNLMPIVLTVIVAYSCSPYERSHIEMREKNRASVLRSNSDIAPYPTYKYDPLLNEVLMTIRNFYVESYDFNSQNDTSLEAIMAKLDDHSYYLEEERNIQSRKKMGLTERTDLGMYLWSVADTPVITSIMPYTFAHEKGLLPGDRIISVDSQSVIGVNVDSLASELSYVLNTNTQLGIYRPSDGMSYYIITKSKSKPKERSVYERMLNDSIGYMRLTKFIEGSYIDVVGALSHLTSLGMKRLVFDLRDNRGGFLEETMEIVNLFFDEHSPILSLRSSAHPSYGLNYYTEYGGKYARLPIVLLVNDGSASASEIIAGVFQDKERATIVGLPTYGKGVSQTSFPLSDGNGCLYLTTRRIYTPTGRCIQMTKAERTQLEDLLSIDTFINNIDHHYELSFLHDTKNYFLTAKGRRVYDSIGVIPDYVVPQYSTAATRIFLWADPVYDSINDIVREKYPRTYIDLPTPTEFYKHFGETDAADYVKGVLQYSPVTIDDTHGQINVKEVMNAIALYYSLKVNSYWAYTREALLDDRQVQFALTLLQPKQEIIKPVVKKVKKSKKVKRSTKS